MARISMIDPETASPAVKEAVKKHLADGYRITNEKRTLLHNVPSFEALEVQSYAVDRELQRLVGERAANFFEYAISIENECIVCTTYFAKLLRSMGITDFDSFDFTEEEKLMIEYGRIIAKDPKQVSDELFARLRSTFSEEAIVVMTTMAVFMVANNYFNDALRVEPEPLSLS
ncbi:MAG: hypothetical protein IJ719_09235 [Clostridia bacterium]|nr:hypothetical protein [Clostridia bacterium]